MSNDILKILNVIKQCTELCKVKIKLFGCTNLSGGNSRGFFSVPEESQIKLGLDKTELTLL